MPMPMLKMLNISRWRTLPCFSRKAEHGQNLPRTLGDFDALPVVQDAGMFSSNPPPVMWLMPWTSQRRITSSTCFT